MQKSNFTVRVELKNAKPEHLKELARRMLRHGFKDTISDRQGAIYQLPPCEFTFEGEVTKDSVLEKAQTAASEVRPDYAVLVTRSGGRTWIGLERITTAI